jgi:hypothetical protein
MLTAGPDTVRQADHRDRRTADRCVASPAGPTSSDVSSRVDLDFMAALTVIRPATRVRERTHPRSGEPHPERAAAGNGPRNLAGVAKPAYRKFARPAPPRSDRLSAAQSEPATQDHSVRGGFLASGGREPTVILRSGVRENADPAPQTLAARVRAVDRESSRAVEKTKI